jgi:hypothetical protein
MTTWSLTVRFVQVRRFGQMQLRKSIAGIIRGLANRLAYEIRRREPQRDRADKVSHLILEAAQTALPNHQADLTVFNTAQSFGVHFSSVHFYFRCRPQSRIPTTWTQRWLELRTRPSSLLAPAGIEALFSFPSSFPPGTTLGCSMSCVSGVSSELTLGSRSPGTTNRTLAEIR